MQSSSQLGVEIFLVHPCNVQLIKFQWSSRDESTCHVLGVIQGALSVLAGVCLLPRTCFTHPGGCWARAWWERVCSYAERRKYFWFLAQELKLGKSLGSSPEEWFLYDKNGSRWQRAGSWSHYPEGRETRIERWKVFISLFSLSESKRQAVVLGLLKCCLFGGVF